MTPTLAELLADPKVKKTGMPFKGPLAAAIDRDEKTNTMRVITEQPTCVPVRGTTFDQPGGIGAEEIPATYWTFGKDRQRVDCPYGGEGDLLYTRESYRVHPESFGLNPGQLRIEWKRDGLKTLAEVDPSIAHMWLSRVNPHRWRPSIHMPQAFARQWSMIEQVEVRRPFPITGDLARAEGISRPVTPMKDFWPDIQDQINETAIKAFTKLWDEINGPRGWGSDVNPWCWSIKFRRLTDAAV